MSLVLSEWESGGIQLLPGRQAAASNCRWQNRVPVLVLWQSCLYSVEGCGVPPQASQRRRSRLLSLEVVSVWRLAGRLLAFYLHVYTLSKLKRIRMQFAWKRHYQISDANLGHNHPWTPLLPYFLEFPTFTLAVIPSASGLWWHDLFQWTWFSLQLWGHRRNVPIRQHGMHGVSDATDGFLPRMWKKRAALYRQQRWRSKQSSAASGPGGGLQSKG